MTTSPAYYCTYFDERYLTRGLALYASLRRHCNPFRLFVLCMSDVCYRQLSDLALAEVVPLRLASLEQDDPELAAVKSARSILEYYFTCTPVLLSWLLATRPEIALLTYLDADLYFFSPPTILFDSLVTASTLIVPHRFSRRNAALAKWGIYNVGWVSFKRDANGLACLAWWRKSCLEWCHDILETDRFADQKYLDQFPSRFSDVHVDEHRGVNLAPWNLDNYIVTRATSGSPLVDGEPVVFFHFHRLRRIVPWLWRTAHTEYGAPLDRNVRQLIYGPYLSELAAAERRLPSVTASTTLRRDRVIFGALQERLRAIASVLWRGGGLWTIGNHVL